MIHDNANITNPYNIDYNNGCIPFIRKFKHLRIIVNSMLDYATNILSRIKVTKKIMGVTSFGIPTKCPSKQSANSAWKHLQTSRCGMVKHGQEVPLVSNH